MEAALKAISEPNRRRILELVATDELTAGEISDHFDVTRPAVSQHLTVLKQAGLIDERREGTRRLYRTRSQGFAEAKLFLEGFWDERLGQLRRAAERSTEGEVLSERISVQREISISATPDTIWRLLTHAKEATQWMGLTASFDLRPGGVYRTEVVPGQTVAGVFVDIDPPARLAFTWGWEGDAQSLVPPGSTIVVIELVSSGQDTVLRLTHHDLPGIASAGSHSRGWAHYLQRLGVVASGGDPGADPWAADPDRLFAELRPPTRDETTTGDTQ